MPVKMIPKRGAAPALRHMPPLRVYILSVLVALLPVALFSFYANRMVEEQAEVQAAAENLQMASLSAIFTEEHFRNAIEFLQAYATDPKFQEDWSRHDLKAIQSDMEHAADLQPEMELISTYTTDGTMNTIAPLDPSVIGRNYAWRDWYKGVVRHWAPYVSETYRITAEPHVLSVAVSVPIKDAGGHPVGIIAAAFSLRQIGQWLAEVRGYGPRTITVVDQQGHVLGSPHIDVLQPAVDLSDYEPVKRALGGERGAGYFRRGGMQRYVAYLPIPSYGWAVISEEPADEVRYQVAGIRQHFLVLGAFFMALALLGGIVLSAFHRRQQRLARRLERISSSEATYRSLVEGATYGIFRSDKDGFVAVNPALVRMLGYESESDVLALDIARDVYRDPNERARLLREYGTSDKPTSFETTWKRKDGSAITVRVSGRAIYGERGEFYNYEGIVEDLTARHLLEEQLRHSEKLAALGRMVSGAAHEINNPLTAILGYAELMLESPSIAPEQRQMLEKIRAQTRRTKTITAQLQSFSSQERTEKRHLCDINAIASNAMRIEDMNFGLHGIEFHEKFDPNIPRVLGDEYQLLEVCMHIINNSVDALKNKRGGSITLRTRSEGEFVVMEFSDTGPGIQDVSRVFDPFYTTKPLGEGVGLSLSASYGIVKEHGGIIQCFNRPEGGATVLVKLPAARETSTGFSSAFAARSGD